MEKEKAIMKREGDSKAISSWHHYIPICLCLSQAGRESHPVLLGRTQSPQSYSRVSFFRERQPSLGKTIALLDDARVCAPKSSLLP
jgi:hypothetical protein